MAFRESHALLKIDDEDFAGAVPAEGEGVLNAAADEEGATVRVVEAETVPAVEEGAGV